MNDLVVFDNPEFGKVRTLVIDNESWFVGKDVAEALGYSNPQKAIRDHVDNEDRTVNDSFTVNGTKASLINESGLYSLILSSKLQTAKKFKRWVTSEVLPILRKTGTYTNPESHIKALVQVRPLCSDDYIKAAQIISGCKNSRLPYVIGLLEKAGFDIPEVKKQSELDVVDARDDKRTQLMTAMKDYSINELMAMFPDIARQVLYRYKNGTNIPKDDRYNTMILILSGENYSM